MTNGNTPQPKTGTDHPSPVQKKVDEVQMILDRWDKRLRGHQEQKRSEKRSEFRGEILVGIPPIHARSIGRPATPARNIRGWGRNVSCNGISFLCQDRIDADEISICIDPQSEKPRWFQGKIVRRREVQNEFWEYGVHLTCRMN